MYEIFCFRGFFSYRLRSFIKLLENIVDGIFFFFIIGHNLKYLLLVIDKIIIGFKHIAVNFCKRNIYLRAFTVTDTSADYNKA